MEPVNLTNVKTSQFIDTSGPHKVAITDTKDHYFNTGSTGFALIMCDENGCTIQDNIVVQENTLWKIKQIADAAKLSDAQQAAFTHEFLEEANVTIITEKDSKGYQKVIKYLPYDADVQSQPQPQAKNDDDQPF